MDQTIAYLSVSTLSIATGFVMGLWWTRPDIKSMKSEIDRLKDENTRQRKYILRDFKVRVTRNGVDVNPDE